MYCTKCGGKLPEAAVFCPVCGTKVEPETVSKAEARSAGPASPAVCTACGSRSLRKIRRGEYLCDYCGSRFLAEEDDAVMSEEDAKAKLMALFEEAARYESRNEIGQELGVLLKGLDLAPENSTLLLKLGRAYWRLGSDEKAMEYFRKAEKADPGNPILHNNIGNIYLTKGQYTAALPFYENAIAALEANPMSVSANDAAVLYANYGNCLGRLGDRRGAKKYLSIAKAKGYSAESLNNVCKALGLNPRRL